MFVIKERLYAHPVDYTQLHSHTHTHTHTYIHTYIHTYDTLVRTPPNE